MTFGERIGSLSAKAQALEIEIKAVEERKKELQSRLDGILGGEIPDLFKEFGFSNAKLDDGTMVKLTKLYTVSTKSKPHLYAWLDDHGMGEIIKDSLQLGKGGFTPELKEFLSQIGTPYKHDELVEPMTLKAAISRHIESGGEYPPPDVATVSIYERATIKRTENE